MVTVGVAEATEEVDRDAPIRVLFVQGSNPMVMCPDTTAVAALLDSLKLWMHAEISEISKNRPFRSFSRGMVRACEDGMVTVLEKQMATLVKA